MNEVTERGLLVLIFHAVLSLCLWVGLALLRFPNWARLECVWALALVKWASLHVFTSKLSDGKPQPVLPRFVALLCLVSPVVQSLRVLVGDSTVDDVGLSPGIGTLLLVSVSSSLACLVWENLQFGDENSEDDNVDSKKQMMRLLKYFKPDTFYLIAAFGFLILGVFCDSYIPLYQGRVIDMLRQGLQTSFLLPIGQLFLLSLGSALFTGCRGGIFMITLSRLNKRLKRLLFHQLTLQDLNFFSENKPGRLSSRLHSDVDMMGRMVALNANVLVRSSVKSVLMFHVLVGLSWELTLLVCVEMLLMAFIQNKYSNLRKVQKEQILECHAQNKELVSEAVGGISTVRSFRGEKEEMRRYNEALGHMCSIQKRAGVYSAVFLIIRRLLIVGIKILMFLQARVLISSGCLTVGKLVSFFLYQGPMSDNLRSILYIFGESVSTKGVISKVFGYLDRRPESKPAGDLAPERLEGRVSFQNVSFSYPATSTSAETAALKSVSMELRPGKVTALVGRSGSGKTTCVSLLKRLYEPQEGNILLDGEPLHKYQHKYLHQKVALVSQNPVLFSGSLRYNIEYGLKEGSLEKVKEVVKKIKAEEVVSDLKDKYDTDIGECGGKLSGGVKQCIAILRALVRDPQVIILDEATSKLDIEAQHAVLPEILSRGRTVLIVAHQLKTVEEADHIVYLENGSIVEEGTHQELMDRRGRYYRQKEELFSSPPS